MKKLTAAILLLVYFTVSTGFVVSIHYCMDKVDSVELGENLNKECGKCGMHIEKNKGCCKDDIKVVKMQLDQTQAKTLVSELPLLACPEVLTSEYFAKPFINALQNDYPLAHGPPLSEQDTYLRNCVFRL